MRKLLMIGVIASMTTVALAQGFPCVPYPVKKILWRCYDRSDVYDQR